MQDALPGRPPQRKTAEQNRKHRAAFKARIETLTRQDFERVFRERDPALSLQLVVAMIKANCFRSVTGLAAHFWKAAWWGRAVGRFLEREGIMSWDQFKGCFSDKPGCEWHHQAERQAATASVIHTHNKPQGKGHTTMSTIRVQMTGGGEEPSQELLRQTPGFTSRQEMSEVLNDPAYKKDPYYRKIAEQALKHTSSRFSMLTSTRQRSTDKRRTYAP